MPQDTREELERIETALLENPDSNLSDATSAEDALLNEKELDALIQEILASDIDVQQAAPEAHLEDGQTRMFRAYDVEKELDDPKDTNPKKGSDGLLITAMCLIFGSMAIVIWCLIRFGGFL